LRTKCATCPCGTKSSTEGGNIISCSISQSRKVFPMPYKRHNFFTTSTKKSRLLGQTPSQISRGRGYTTNQPAKDNQNTIVTTPKMVDVFFNDCFLPNVPMSGAEACSAEASARWACWAATHYQAEW